MKRAQRGGGVVVRMYESMGRPTTTALHTTLKHRGAVETDLLERPIGSADLTKLDFGRFEIKTILLET